MIHMQEKMELLSQQVDIANNLMEQKIMSREWIYDNIFQFNDSDKTKIFDGIIEDQKQNFRFEQISMEGNDPVKTGESRGTATDLEMMKAGGEEGGGMEEDLDWGGDRRSGTGEKKPDTGFSAEDLKNATSYERGTNGKRQFKGGSPLATSKGSTAVTREGLLNSLKKKFGNDTTDKSILNEKIIIDEE